MRILEIVSGLATGGAEKLFVSRMNSSYNQNETYILNSRPKLNHLNIMLEKKYKVDTIPKINYRFLKIFSEYIDRKSVV